MSNYLDAPMPDGNGQLVMDTRGKRLYDSRYYTLFQRHKFAREFDAMRPDLNAVDSEAWVSKFHLAEAVINTLCHMQFNSTGAFATRFGDRYYSLLDGTMAQMLQFNNTRSQLREGMRTGPYAEVQAKVNFIERVLDKVHGYDIMYPTGEGATERQAHVAQTSVKERQDAVRDRLLREMGVDYALLK